MTLNKQRMETPTISTDEIEEHRDAMEDFKSRCEGNFRICGTSVTSKRKRPPATLERVKPRAKERCTMGLEISHVVDTALGNEEAQCWFTTQVHAKSTSRKIRNRGTSKNGRREEETSFEYGNGKGKSEERTSTRCKRHNGSGAERLVGN